MSQFIFNASVLNVDVSNVWNLITWVRCLLYIRLSPSWHSFALTSLWRLGWWWFWGCEVCLSAAGAGRRFHSSPEFSPPECLLVAHHTTRWMCTSSTSAAHPLAAPFHTSRKRQTSRLTLWLSLQSFNKLILLLVSVLSWTTQKENWNRDFCKAIPNHPKLPKAIRFPKTLILSFFSKDDNSSTFDNLAGLVEITISISSRTSIQDEAVLHVL